MSAQSETATEYGKGPFPRTWNTPTYRDHYEAIFRKPKPQDALPPGHEWHPNVFEGVVDHDQIS